jgi:pyruvate, water dikinase
MLRVPDARFIVAFDRASEADSVRVGGKCAGLARMIAAGVNVPNGFAITTDAYAEHLESGRLGSRIESLMRSIDIGNVDDEEEKSSEIRRLIMSAAMPAGVEAEIRRA